jgi:hypothetical protein
MTYNRALQGIAPNIVSEGNSLAVGIAAVARLVAPASNAHYNHRAGQVLHVRLHFLSFFPPGFPAGRGVLL